MRLGIRMLNSSSTVNDLKIIKQVIVNPGESGEIYFQLLDLDLQDDACPHRYIPSNTATLEATIVSLNNANTLVKIPSQAFPQDGSIWKFSYSSDDSMKMAGVNLRVKLVDGSNVKIVEAKQVIIVTPKNTYGC